MDSTIQPDYRLFVKNNSNYNISELLHQMLNDPSISQKLLNNNNNLVTINDCNKIQTINSNNNKSYRRKIRKYYIKIKKPKHTHSDTSMCSSTNDEKN